MGGMAVTSFPVRRMCNGALAGLAGIAAWIIVMPWDKRLFRSDYDDIELLGTPFARGRAAWFLGLVLHMLNGLTFGAVYALAAEPNLRGSGWLRGFITAELEGTSFSTFCPVLDRIHPGIRGGCTGKTATLPAVAQGIIRHAVFGVVLGFVFEILEQRSHARDASR
ncbi:MAG: hypothetical protein M1118_02695 [Chloroflexi bacterium]|nr:hypothetical protein [Chloroflexota bacterium]